MTTMDEAAIDPLVRNTPTHVSSGQVVKHTGIAPSVVFVSGTDRVKTESSASS